MSDTSKAIAEKIEIVDAAAGRIPCDVVLKNARYINVFFNEILDGDIGIKNGMIVGIGTYSGNVEYDLSGRIISPGFIDSHIHLESSLVTPKEFIKIALPHGTTTIVTDPHEITNVMGTDGIDYMLEATNGLPIDVRFMIPSCVPATPNDESGANLSAEDIAPYYKKDRVIGLAEMMNAFGVVHDDKDVLTKLTGAQQEGCPIDGHAPGLTGNELNAYAAAGVTSDHECSNVEEALEKLRRGQYIMIREGTAARNLEALAPLLRSRYADRCTLCTDDKHPNDLLEKGHIDGIIREAVLKYDADPIAAVKAGSYNAAQYFGLADCGAIAPGYTADLVVLDNLENFCVEKVFHRGNLVCDGGELIDYPTPVISESLAKKAEDTFHMASVTAEDFTIKKPLGILGMIPGEIITTDEGMADRADPAQDLLLSAVIERHHNTGHIGLGLMKGYGLKAGAVATSISHDSHNIVVIGTSEEDMALAVNRVAENHGGIVVAKDGQILNEVVLEIAGLMSNQPLPKISADLEMAKKTAYSLGVNAGIDPFMTLSFMCLSVIPKLRLMPQGVFDAETQKYL